jgi:hydroxyacylglutathione hydrolase
MKIETFVLGPVLTNAYLVYDEEKKKGIVIDPGMGPASLVKRIAELELKVEAILLTHAHFDHIGGVEEVRAATGAPVYVHEEEAGWLEDPKRNGSGFWPGLPLISCRPAEHLLSGGERLTFFGRTFEVLHTPGHSPGSVSFLSGEVLFGGDVLFKDSIGRTDLPGGDYDTLMRSIHDKIMVLSETVRVMPGHGPETTVGREQEKNPFVTGLL